MVARLRHPEPGPNEIALARAQQLLERYGVLTREAALGEGIEGGFAGVYPVLRAMEDKGVVRRGYFVAGLGAAQFALPGAVDRLRSARRTATPRGRSEPAAPAEPPGPLSSGWTRDGDPTALDRGWAPGDLDKPDALGRVEGSSPELDEPAEAPLVLAATDPAQPYGASLPWPPSGGRPARAAGALVVLAEGLPLAYLERGGRSVSLFRSEALGPDEMSVDVAAPESDPALDPRWARALAGLVADGRRRSIEVTKVDGVAVRESPAADTLRAAGFTDSYRGLVRR